MSYSVSVSGHIEGDADAARAKEEAAVVAAKEFVASLPGASLASFSGQFTGFTDLLPTATASEDASNSEPAPE